MNETTMGTGADAVGEAKAWLQQVEVGEGVHHENLTVFPLFWRKSTMGDSVTGSLPPEPPIQSPDSPAEEGSVTGSSPPKPPIQSPNPPPERYVLLQEAIEAGEAVVEEVDEGGEVPFLGVQNGSIKPILIPEGEILVGAKQNRTVNITVLVAAGVKFTLPVSCVEQGRWRYQSRHFKAESYAHPRLREKKLKSAQRNRALGFKPRSDQGEVWGVVEKHIQTMDAHAPTRDLVAATRQSEKRLEDYRQTISLPEGACGFLAARGGEVVGLDLFDSPVTMRKLWKRLGDAYFVGALSESDAAAEATKDLAEGFLSTVVDRLEPASEQPQLGVELELADGDISGAALWHDGAVCHLAAFPVEG